MEMNLKDGSKVGARHWKLTRKVKTMTKLECDSYDTIATAIHLLKVAPRSEYHAPDKMGKGEVIYVNPYGEDAPSTTWVAEAAFGIGPDSDNIGAFIITDAYGTPILTGVEDIELANAYNERKSNIDIH